MSISQAASASMAMPESASSSGASPRLEVARISKRFGERIAVENVSFSVRERELVAVLGPSGAGKTTLFRCMTGLLAPDTGTVRLAGVDIASLQGRARRKVAVVFQQFNLVSRLSALDNVLAGRLGHSAQWRGWIRRFERADRLLALECLDRVGLLAHAAQRADTLSGGQQQRVAIARALAQQPDIIVADEPVASLDPTIGGGILELLRAISHDDGVSVVCSLHQVHFARAFADRIVGMVAGRVQLDTRVAAFDESAASELYRDANAGIPRLVT